MKTRAWLVVPVVVALLGGACQFAHTQTAQKPQVISVPQDAAAKGAVPSSSAQGDSTPAMQAPTAAPVTGTKRSSYNTCNVEGPYIALTFDDGPHATLTPKLLDILRDPVKEFRKAALSSRDLETARQLAHIELAALVCWKAPHLVADALMEPELSREALLAAPGASTIEKKINLEASLQEAQRREYHRLLTQGQNLGKLILLNRGASYEWLESLKSGKEGVPNPPIPALSQEELRAISAALKQREAFQPWTHRMVEAISRLPYIRRRYRYQEYVQKVGRLEADGWLVRVYVNLDPGGS